MGDHINGDGKFQSDKYPTCPAGKVPLSTRDPNAQDLLWRYAQRRRPIDAEFSADLETCLQGDGFVVKDQETIRGRVTELVGEASVLFGPAVGVEVFDTDKAKDIVERILDLIDPLSRDLTIRIGENDFLEIEGLRFSVTYLKEVLRHPPEDLFSVTRNGDYLQFTSYPKAVMTMRSEFLTWLDTQEITRETIGAIRTSCFVPWDSEWNGFVRDQTAIREKPAAK